jgi:hypothetical protein
MYAWNITKNQLQEIADDYDFILKIGNPPSSKAISFTLRLPHEDDRKRPCDDNIYRHKSISFFGERWTSSVCYHGHYDFLYDVFEQTDCTRVKSAFADYTKDTFLEKARELAHYNIGAQIMPVSMIESCECGAYGYGLRHH